MSEKQISLAYREGGSDKVYQAQVDAKGGGFVMNFQYGRRGSTLTAGTKTKDPVSLEEAIKIFEKVVKEKQAKGYTEDGSGTPYVGGDKAERVSGLAVQLLNPATENEARQMINDSNYVLQEKLDGKRMLLRFDERLDVATSAINRSGLTCGAPDEMLQAFRNAAIDKGLLTVIIDGECIGEKFYAFDLLEYNGGDHRHNSYEDRHSLLRSVLRGSALDFGLLNVVPVLETVEVKRLTFLRMQESGKEGVVFKNRHAPYTPGRPNSGGSQFKFKFQAEATCRVSAVSSSKRSFEIQVATEAGPNAYVTVGNVTVPANKEFPEVGQQVEIRYLYAFRGGSLFQPFFKGVRDDKDWPDKYESLKFKGEAKKQAA